MEMVFTTLEHTARMFETTGENRDLKRSELDAKKERLNRLLPLRWRSHSAMVGSKAARNASITKRWLRR